MHSGTQKQESQSLPIQETKKGLKPTIKIIGHPTEEPQEGIGCHESGIEWNGAPGFPAYELFGSGTRD